MADGVATLYITCSEIKLFKNIEKLFIQQGISLFEPRSGFVKMSDENYDIRNYTRDDLLEKLFQNNQVGFQWWWGECDDLYCCIKSVGQLSVIELYIECTTKEQTEKILNSFLEISQNIIDIPIGFIIDRSGYLNENNYNIDDFLVGQTSEIHNHIIAIASDLKEKTTLNFDGHQIDEIMNVIEDSVVVGTKYETREMITIIR